MSVIYRYITQITLCRRDKMYFSQNQELMMLCANKDSKILILCPVFSAYSVLKFMIVWMLVLLADFVLEFRLEYLWPCWLFLGTVYTTFHCHGLVMQHAIVVFTFRNNNKTQSMIKNEFSCSIFLSNMLYFNIMLCCIYVHFKLL